MNLIVIQIKNRVRITIKLIVFIKKSLKLFFSKGYIQNWSREIFFIEFILKTNPWTFENLILDKLCY